MRTSLGIQIKTVRNGTVKQRDFYKLTMAAIGALVARTAVSMVQAQKKNEQPKLCVDPGLLLVTVHGPGLAHFSGGKHVALPLHQQ